MKGLLLKELYTVKRHIKIYLLYVAIFGGAAIFTGSVGMYSAMSVVFMTSLPFSTFTVDEACKWDKLAISAPLSRKTIVGSKYLMLIASTVASFLLGMGVMGLGMLVRSDVMDPESFIVGMVVTICLMGIMMMVLMPVIFKVGSEKGRLLMMLMFGGTFLAIMLGAVLLDNMGVMGNATDNVKISVIFGSTVIMPIVLAIAAFISYKVSCHVYQKREF